MEIKGTTQIYGIYGYPVQHSISPQLHNAVFKKRSEDAVYLPFEVKPDYLSEAMSALRSLSIRGINITLPHKEGACHFVDEIPEDLDRAIGAINTIVMRNGKLMGFNTDGAALMEDLKESLAFAPDNARVFLVGAGGTARCAAFYLLRHQCGELLIYNRTPDRAKGLAEYLLKFFPKSRVRAVLSLEEAGKSPADLLLNASACGMRPEDSFPISPVLLDRIRCVYDVIYTPPRTRLLEEAQKRRIRSAGGIGMLVRQACRTQGLWFPNASKKEVFLTMRETAERCLGS